jgi:hypothetical protein
MNELILADAVILRVTVPEQEKLATLRSSISLPPYKPTVKSNDFSLLPISATGMGVLSAFIVKSGLVFNPGGGGYTTTVPAILLIKVKNMTIAMQRNMPYFASCFIYFLHLIFKSNLSNLE